jgi:hypothetical protein
VLPSGQKLSLGTLATITLEVVPFHTYAPFPALLPFLNASWKSCSVRVFSITCDSALVTSVVLKKQKGWAGNESQFVFGKKIPWWKKKWETVCCRDVTASSFVAKIMIEVFAHFQAVAVKSHSSMRK